MLQCERCGRMGPGEIAACPYHADHTCAFIYETEIDPSASNLTWGGIAAVWLVGMAVAAIVGLLSERAIWPVAGLVLVTALCLSLAVGKTWNRRLLYNPDTGQMWRETWVLGLLWEQVVAGPTRPLDLNVRFGYDLRYPASVTTFLARQESRPVALQTGKSPTNLAKLLLLDTGKDAAVHTFFAALVALLAADAVAVQVIPVHRRFIVSLMGKAKPRPMYLLVPGPNADARPDGELEEHILSVLKSWDMRPAAKKWPQGAPLYDLVKTVFPYKSEYGSTAQLVDLVRNDAVSHRLGAMPGGPPLFKVEEAVAPKVAQEADEVRAAGDALAQAAPEFHAHVQGQLRRAL